MYLIIMALVGALVGVLVGWFMIFKPNHSVVNKKPKPGKYTNKRGTKHYKINNNGSMEMLEDYFFGDRVQKDLHAMGRMYKRQTILALWRDKTPPTEVGGYGILTKKKLIIEWNDDWQAEMDELNESYDLDYNILFGIPEEHPESGIVYTADEIANQYGREEENS